MTVEISEEHEHTWNCWLNETCERYGSFIGWSEKNTNKDDLFDLAERIERILSSLFRTDQPVPQTAAGWI
jgi:hypothetical protein